MTSGIKETGVYFVTPSELAAKVAADPSFHDVGVKMGARVVHGSITRNVGTQTITFQVTDGTQTYPVVYRGLAPDTFTDDVDVVVEGRLEADGTFRATTLLAKCGSRYETTPQA
jgi:cytochrome c-type biogenesis protein CcmE